MPWIGPLSRLARGRDVRTGNFFAGARFLLVERAPGALAAVVALRFLLGAFFTEPFVLEVRLLEAFLPEGFLRLLFLLAALAGPDFLAVFSALIFLFPEAFFPVVFFLAAGLFFDTFLDTFFEPFPDAFFREAAFLPFEAAGFFLVALRFLDAVLDAVLRVAAFRFAAFLPAALAFFRFLLAVVLEGIFYSCRTEKRRGLYMA